jgi:Rad3-related DNA helicase
MKQFSDKSKSAPVFASTAAIALVCVSVYAIRSGRLTKFMQDNKRRTLDKFAPLDRQVESIIVQNTTLHQQIELVLSELGTMAAKNDKLAAENKLLAQTLEEEHDRVIKLMNLLADETEEKLALMQKLEEIDSKLLRMEQTSGNPKEPETALPEVFIA